MNRTLVWVAELANAAALPSPHWSILGVSFCSAPVLALLSSLPRRSQREAVASGVTVPWQHPVVETVGFLPLVLGLPVGEQTVTQPQPYVSRHTLGDNVAFQAGIWSLHTGLPFLLRQCPATSPRTRGRRGRAGGNPTEGGFNPGFHTSSPCALG